MTEFNKKVNDELKRCNQKKVDGKIYVRKQCLFFIP